MTKKIEFGFILHNREMKNIIYEKLMEIDRSTFVI